MRCCIACGKSIVRGASLPVNPIRRQEFLENICLTKYSEFIAHKCFLCFEHFDPDDILEVNGEKKLRHCQVKPIKLSAPLPNPKFEQKVNKLASARLAWSESRADNDEEMSEDDEEEDEEEEEEESEVKTEDDKDYTPNTSRASKQSSAKKRKVANLAAQRLDAIRAAKLKGMRPSNPTTPLQPEYGPQGRSLKLGRPSGYSLPSGITRDGLILNTNMSQCFLCSKVISNGVKIPQNSYYRSIWREGLHLNGYLPKAGMICFRHFRLDDLVFDSAGVPCNTKLGVAPVFNKVPDEPKAVLENIPRMIAKEAMERRSLQTLQPLTSVGTSRKRKDSSTAPDEEVNEQEKAASMQKIAENAEKRKKVLQQGLCGAVIKTLKEVNLDQPGKQSTCELNEMTNTRFYEPHYRPEDEVYCLSQVTQIGEKICTIENKFTQLMELVTEFVMAKTNAAAPPSSAVAAPPISREQYKERQQALSLEMKRKALQEQKRLSKKARRLANTNKMLEEKRKRREEQKKHQPFLLYNGIKIYYPTAIRNMSTVCKVCFAAFENKVLLADHLFTQDDLSDEYYKCLVCDVNVFYLSEKAVQQHVLEAHGKEHANSYALHEDLPLKTQETLRSYAEKMFGDQGNVIGLDSDSDGQPSSFFEATAKKVKMDRNPVSRGGGITANVVIRESGGPDAMQIVQSLFASSNATAVERAEEDNPSENSGDGAAKEEMLLQKNAEVMASNELLDELLSEAKEMEQNNA